MKKFNSICLFITLSVFGFGYGQDLNIFVSTHPDDWQLFMNPNAYHSLDSIQNKTIFLHTTAGDAGHEINDNYYLAREEGSLRAIRFMVNAHNHKQGYGKDMIIDSSKINGHPILNYEYANAKAYFMRLHDGYIVTDTMMEHPQSLRNFYTGKINSISAIDGSTDYKSLDDLKTTIKELINKESKGYGSIALHIADTDSIINPNDHPDHLHSSKIMQDVAKEIPDITVYLYQEYSTQLKPMNVFPEDFLIQVGTWGATASGLSDAGYYTTWDAGHNSWMGRQYFRKLE